MFRISSRDKVVWTGGILKLTRTKMFKSDRFMRKDNSASIKCRNQHIPTQLEIFQYWDKALCFPIFGIFEVSECVVIFKLTASMWVGERKSRLNFHAANFAPCKISTRQNFYAAKFRRGENSAGQILNAAKILLSKFYTRRNFLAAKFFIEKLSDTILCISVKANNI